MPFLRSRWAESYFDWLFAKRKTVYFLFFVMTSISIFFTARLKLKTDFAALLPDRLPSVQNLHKVTGRIGGTGALLIGAESPSFAANKKFMNALSEKLEPLNGVTLRYHEYKYLESRDYLYKYGLHYLSNEQLATFHNFVENTIVKEKDKSVGSFLGLDEPEE